MADLTVPAALALSAYVPGEGPAVGDVVESGRRWYGAEDGLLDEASTLAPPPEVDAWDWEDPSIGWGVVMADDDAVPAADKAVAKDGPAAIQRLVQARGGAPVLRYRPDKGVGSLIRYHPDGTDEPPSVTGSDFGVGRGRIPRFLLIVGGPDKVPWAVQFSLNRRYQVGRLDLPDDALERYVDALLSGWPDDGPSPTSAVVWSTDHDSMSRTMDVTIAQRVDTALAGDNELTVTRIAGAGATLAALTSAVAAVRPALVVTCSHGQTGPLDDPVAMEASLGLPVDQELRVLDIASLTSAWDPYGALWIAQACCSAGSNAGTAYRGLLAEGSLAERVVSAVGRLGAAVAPLPTALLGGERPIRGFIGQVEPTFDWTLYTPGTGQQVTGQMVAGVYPGLYRGRPVASAFAPYYGDLGGLYGAYRDARDDADMGEDAAVASAVYFKLTAMDRESMVLLGDPTAVLPPLPSQG